MLYYCFFIFSSVFALLHYVFLCCLSLQGSRVATLPPFGSTNPHCWTQPISIVWIRKRMIQVFFQNGLPIDQTLVSTSCQTGNWLRHLPPCLMSFSLACGRSGVRNQVATAPSRLTGNDNSTAKLSLTSATEHAIETSMFCSHKHWTYFIFEKVKEMGGGGGGQTIPPFRFRHLYKACTLKYYLPWKRPPKNDWINSYM